MQETQPSEGRMRAGDWHGNQAIKAYRRRDYDAYRRHARIAEILWKDGDAALIWGPLKETRG